jgi:division protein CdvB (Snf7/Vps24/ESCRT-III family)
MAFFGLFKSSAAREHEARLRFRQGKARIQRFVQQSRQSAERYWQLAQQAHRLADMEQLRSLAQQFYRARDSVNRWERFLLKMEALEMRRNEVEATGDFVRNMHSLTSSILRSSSAAEIATMQLEVEKAIAKAEEQTELLTEVMDVSGQKILSSEALSEESLEQLLKGIVPQALAGERASNEGFEAVMAKLETNLPKDVMREVTP